MSERDRFLGVLVRWVLSEGDGCDLARLGVRFFTVRLVFGFSCLKGIFLLFRVVTLSIGV